MAERKEVQEVFSTSNVGSSNSSGFKVRLGEAPLSWPRGPDSTETTCRRQASGPGVVDTVAAALQNEAAAATPQTAGAVGQTVVADAAKIATAAAQAGEAEENRGAFATAGDDGNDACTVGQHCKQVPSGGTVESSGWDAEGLVQHEQGTLVTAATESALGSTRTRLTAGGTAEVPTACPMTLRATTSTAAGVLVGSSRNSLGAAGESLPDSGSTSAEASEALVERACHVCEEYDGQNGSRRLALAVESFAAEGAEEFAEEQSTSAAEAEGVGAGSACDGSTSSSASDCCGCVGPTAETSVCDAAGVPPYLRIETLPELLEEGLGGRVCVLLGQKKEALLYSVATPFGVNKCILVCIYMLYAFLTGCVYFGWPSLSYMLLTSGAYSWRCPKDSNGEFINDLRKPQNTSDGNSSDGSSGTAGDKGGKYYICDEQDAAVGPLFTIAYVTQSLMSVVAGTLLDHVSPKRAAMLGQLLNAVGWSLLACSSYTFQAYIPAMVFIGLGADTAYLPTLLIAALFPGKRATVITLLGSANTASFAVPMLLEMLWKTKPAWKFSHICCLYLAVGPFFCFCLAALFIPRSSFGSAALRKLPLQQQQSPLHGSKEDALLRAEERDTKKPSVTRKGRRSGWCCCCSCFGVSSQDQLEERRRHQPLPQHTRIYLLRRSYACGGCSDVEPEARTRKKTASGRRQRLRRFLISVLRGCRLLLPSILKLLQRTPRVRLCCKSNVEQGTGAHVVSQQQPRVHDPERQQSEPSSNCGCWRGDKITRNDWDGRIDGRATAGDLSTAAASAAEEIVPETGTITGVLAATDNVAAGTDVEAQVDGSAPRIVNNGELSLITCDDIGETRNGTAVHAEGADAIEPHDNKGGRVSMCADDGSIDKLHTREDFCCVCARYAEDRDRAASAVQEQQSSFLASFFPGPSSADEGAVKTTTNPPQCRRCMVSRSVAQADVGSGDEEDAEALTAIYPVAPAGPSELCSPAAAVEVEEEEEEEEPSFCSQLLSSHFMCIVLYWSGMAVAISYFQSTASRLFSTTALDFMDVALSFSFVSCVLLGKMIDLFGPFPALFLVNTMGVLAYCFALGGGSEQNMLQYVSILAFCVYVSVDSEQVFCYVENTFNAKHFGKLSGLALTTGGVISLVSIPLYDEVTLRILERNPLPVCCGLMIVLVLLYFTLGSMWFVRSKHPPAFKAKKKRLGTAATATPVAAMDTALAAAGRIATGAGEQKGEEAYAVDDDETHTAAGLPSCLRRRHSQCCCCCSGCAGANSSSNMRRMSVRSQNSSDVWRQSGIISTNVENNRAARWPVGFIGRLLKRLRDRFSGRDGRTTAVEVLQQQREAERQQQQRRRSRLENEQDHLQDEVI